MTSELNILKQKIVPLSDNLNNVHDGIINAIGDASIVMIGEASHGTHDFYKYRAEITKRLIMEKGFQVVAVEADFPDAYRINRYVKGFGYDKTAEESLRDFKRFPLWMWRNNDVLDFVNWLRKHNDKVPASENKKVGFFGLDLYSMHSSMHAVLKYLKKTDEEAYKRAVKRYSCFDSHGKDPQTYGYRASRDKSKSCEKPVLNQLVEMRQKKNDFIKDNGGWIKEDEFFYAEQNAKLVKDAEGYYREMYEGDVDSWNLRDRHMADTVIAIEEHLLKQGFKQAKIVVWEHNSHLGDASQTEEVKRGQWNVGQLLREKYGKDKTFIIGFTTDHGTVTCASNWGESAEVKKVRPGMFKSWERLFHEVNVPRFFLNTRDEAVIKELDNKNYLERAIGVIYAPETERYSHYFEANLPKQFDLMIHFDKTKAIVPLEKVSTWKSEDLPETYPQGL